MATDPVDPRDPIEEEARQAFADPEVQKRIEEYVERRRRGQPARRYSSDEVRRRFGLPPADRE